MPTPFPLEIVTLQRVVFKGETERLSLVGGEGSLAIEARHAPLVTNVVPCAVQVRSVPGRGDLQYAVSAGFLLVTADGASLLVDSAEPAEDIDPERARAAQARAEERLHSDDPEMDMTRAKAALARAVARLRVLQPR